MNGRRLVQACALVVAFALAACNGTAGTTPTPVPSVGDVTHMFITIKVGNHSTHGMWVTPYWKYKNLLVKTDWRIEDGQAKCVVAQYGGEYFDIHYWTITPVSFPEAKVQAEVKSGRNCNGPTLSTFESEVCEPLVEPTLLLYTDINEPRPNDFLFSKFYQNGGEGQPC